MIHHIECDCWVTTTKAMKSIFFSEESQELASSTYDPGSSLPLFYLSKSFSLDTSYNTTFQITLSYLTVC